MAVIATPPHSLPEPHRGAAAQRPDLNPDLNPDPGLNAHPNLNLAPNPNLAEARDPIESRDPVEAPNPAEPLILAVPKGRILAELVPLLTRAGIRIEAAFDDPDSRQLRFATNVPGLDVVRVRNFDVATFVAFGAAHLGVAGNDVLMEFDYPEIYAPLDLDIGHCRLAVAGPAELARRDDPARWSHLRVATKYPELSRRYFARRGVQAEIIKLNGAMELAPLIGLCRRIVDLVQTGATLKANGLVEMEQIAAISSRLIVNRTILKTRPEEIQFWIDRFRAALGDAG